MVPCGYGVVSVSLPAGICCGRPLLDWTAAFKSCVHKSSISLLLCRRSCSYRSVCNMSHLTSGTYILTNAMSGTAMEVWLGHNGTVRGNLFSGNANQQVSTGLAMSPARPVDHGCSGGSSHTGTVLLP